MNWSTQIKRYLAFYITTALLYTLWSYFIDLVFTQISRGSVEKYPAKGFEYFIWFVLGYFFLTHFLVAVYLYITTILWKILRVHLRFLFALIFSLTLGLAIGDQGPNYYIGKYSELKAPILYPLIAVSIEIIRFFYSKSRSKVNVYTEE